MSRGVKRFLYWVPRGLGIAFAVFISLFALDVFGEGYGFPDVVVAFLIHLVPTYLVLIALAIAWRWEWVGAAVLWALGAFYIWMFRGDFDPHRGLALGELFDADVHGDQWVGKFVLVLGAARGDGVRPRPRGPAN